MKIEKYVKNRAKQVKVGHLIITYLAFKFVNMALSVNTVVEFHGEAGEIQ